MNKHKEIDIKLKASRHPKPFESKTIKIITKDNFYTENCCDIPHFGSCPYDNKKGLVENE